MLTVDQSQPPISLISPIEEQGYLDLTGLLRNTSPMGSFGMQH